MKKTTEVFLIIGIVEGFVTAALCIVFGILGVAFGSGSYHAEIIKLIKEGQITIPQGKTIEETAVLVERALTTLGAFSFIGAFSAAACGVLSIYTRNSIAKEDDKAKVLSIVSIVFGAIGCIPATLVGGILGTIYTSKKKL